MSSRNALLGQKLCHYLHEGRTLNELLSVPKQIFSLELLRAF